MADLQLTGVAPAGGANSTSLPAAPAAAATAAPMGAAKAAAPPADPQAAAASGVPASGADAGKTAATPPDSKLKDAAKEAVKGANAALAASGTLLVFVFDDQAHHMAVKLLDVQTQKVVQQIPLQHMPATASALAGDTASGALVDTKA